MRLGGPAVRDRMRACPCPGAFSLGGQHMSNLKDAVGLRHAYGKAASQLDTEFDPSTGTLWGYMNPRGTPCFTLGLLKEIREHDAELETNRARVLAGGE